MARIIDPAPQPEAEKTAICHDGCGAKIGYTIGDVRVYNGKDISGGPDGRKWIVCPKCGKDITIKSW